MPFHWNATSVQIIPDNNPPTLHQSAQRTRMPQQGGNRWESSTNGADTSSRHNDRSNNYRNHEHRDRDMAHSRRSPVHNRRDNIHPVRRRSPPPRRSSPGKSPMRRPEKRERSPRSSPPRRYRDESRTREESGPPSRRARVTPRYICKSVRPLISKNVTCSDLRQRYSRLYVPSDFITCEMSWLDSFALDAPFQIGLNPISFHPVHKDVDIPVGTYPPEELESPGDEDNRFIVRTLLLSHSGIADIRKKVFGLLPDGSIDENAETVPFNKAIQFLTGIRGRNEVMAIGGAYSPSKDGENPLDLPTLIKTAVRSTRELTGVDLSTCPTWYKIAHLEYYRAERDRVDNVILLMPDTSSMNTLMPTPEQYESIITTLKAQLAEKISAIESEEFISSVEKKRKEAGALKESTTTSSEENVISGDQTASVVPSSDSKAADDANGASAPTHTAEPTSTTTTTTDAKPKSNDVNMEDDDEDEPIEKLHWSTVLSTLRVAELREQLTIRGLDTKGVKNVLINRLQKALDEEKLAEETAKATAAEIKSEPVAETKEEPMETSIEEEKKEPEVEAIAAEAEGEQEITLDQLVEKQDDDDFTPEELEEIRREKEKWDVIQNERKQALIRHFVFPEQPTVFAYPNKSIKGGRFDCKVSSLLSLLDYRIEDNKESSFEVFIYAEVIREMLERSYAFNVYKTLQSINELDVETQKRKDALTAAIAPPPAETNNEAMENGKEEAKVEAATNDGDKEKEREKTERELLTAFKQLVGNFDLFTSFAYYDQNLSGYLADKDCEDIVLSIGLRISRGDVVRLLKKVVSRDNFNYRMFTDRWVDKDNETKYAAGFRDDAPSVETLLNLHPKESSGNDGDKKKTFTGTPDVTENGVVIYKGAALNIKQSLERHQEIKEECTKLTTQLQEQDFVLKSYKEQVDTLEKKRDRLQTDVAHYRKKANEAEKCLKTNEDDVVAFKQSLQDCKRLGDRICGIVERVMPTKEKTKEPSAKPETSPKKGSDAAAKDASEKPADESESAEMNVPVETTEETNGEAKDVEAEPKEGEDELMDEDATEETSA
uniref:SAP domain-containing protein n=1 Tax=Panagrolaimus superbus TaxID=310955 RepID=A0A914Z9H8_9BILA